MLQEYDCFFTFRAGVVGDVNRDQVVDAWACNSYNFLFNAERDFIMSKKCAIQRNEKFIV